MMSDRILDDAQTTVAVFGWCVVGVRAAGEIPRYSYTVGLTEQSHPELVIVGLDHDIARDALNVSSSAVCGGEPFELGERYNGVLGKSEVLIHEADPKFTPPGIARAFYADKVNLWAMLWPDSEERWPWYEGARNSGQMSSALLEAAREKFKQGSKS